MSFCNSLTFFRIWTSAKAQPISSVIWQSHGVNLVNINVYAKFHHNIPLSSTDSAIIPFSELELGKASTNEKCHFAITWARSCQYQCLRNSLSKYSTQFKRQGHFHFFRIWRSAKPRPMINVILQFIELDLVNINVSAKFYQNIPNGLRVKFHCFQNLNLGKTSTNPKVIWLSHGLHHVNINVYAKFHHNIPLSSRDRTIFTFSEFGARQSLDWWKMSFRNLLG